MTRKANTISYIDFFRQCYRADSRDISLWNVNKIRKDRKSFIAGKDDLVSGELPRLPLAGDIAESLLTQAETYQRERLLVYGTCFVGGRAEAAGFVSESRTICAPLIYYPVKIYRDSEIYVEIHKDDCRINYPLLRQILLEDVDVSIVEKFPVITNGLKPENLSEITQWLKQYTCVSQMEELGRWPNLLDETQIKAFTRKKSLSVFSASVIALVDRARGSRGVLHELREIIARGELSRSLNAIFQSDVRVKPSKNDSDPDLLPGVLSVPQTKILENASIFPLSLVSGPPGTGKSYTIAAIAIDRMLKGESVLVVSKTSQAVNVIADKLKEDFQLTSGFVASEGESLLKGVKAYLDKLLKEGLPQPEKSSRKVYSELKKTRKQLKKVEVIFGKQLKKSSTFSQLLRRKELGNDSLIDRFQYLIFNYQLMNASSLWKILKKIKSLKVSVEKQSAEYVISYHQERISALLKRKRIVLSKFNQAIRARNSSRQEGYFKSVDEKTLLKTFPIWLIRAEELHQILPLKKEMFDVVIFDEATQCDIASAIPAFYRAGRAVVVGDSKQLRHVSFLSRNQEQKIAEKTVLHEGEKIELSYRDQSILDLTSDNLITQDAVTLLDEHFRSKAELICYSNEKFYSNRLKVMKARPGKSPGKPLEFISIDGERDKNGINKEECDVALNLVRQHLKKYSETRVAPTVGILSPYRNQAEYIQAQTLKAFALQEADKISLRVATPYGFQGEERDIMILSMGVDDSCKRAFAYLNREDMFNVAITRAKEKMVVLHSCNPVSLPIDNQFRCFYESQFTRSKSMNDDPEICKFIDSFSEVLESYGVKLWRNYEIAGQEVDLLCQNGNTLIGLDLIGVADTEKDYFDLETYRILDRAGLHIIPIPYYHWILRREECLRGIKMALGMPE